DGGQRDVDDAFLRTEPSQLAFRRQFAPERRRLIDNLLERATDDERPKGADGFDAHLVAATDGERKAVPLEMTVGLEDDVRRRIIRIRMHRVGTVGRPRGWEPQIDDFQVTNSHAAVPCVDRMRSSVTAATMMPPVTICCTQFASPFCEQPIWMMVMMAAPIIVPATDPRPPVRLPPPMMTAAITSSSAPTPTVGSPTDSFENWSRPAAPVSRPDSA